MLHILTFIFAFATTDDVTLSAEAQTLIAPVHRAYAELDAAQAKEPPPATDRERLEQLYDLDQVGRLAFEKIDLSRLPKQERDAALKAMLTEIGARDLANQAELKRMAPQGGWFTPKDYGRRASEAAFLIVQHATNDPDLMKSTLAKLKPLAERGEVDGGEFALMYDRVALEFEHAPQRYGSQVACKEGVWTPVDLDDAIHVDERRKAIGLKETEAEYLKHFSDLPCHK